MYPLLPVPPDLSSPSGEPGQIAIDGIVAALNVFCGRVDDEADWHIYITPPIEVSDILANSFSENGVTVLDLIIMYCELMVLDDWNKPFLGDDRFHSADGLTQALLLTKFGSEHPAWDLGQDAMDNQGSSQDYTENSHLAVNHARVYMQGAFVNDADHGFRIEIHPLDSLAVAMKDTAWSSVVSAKFGENDWPKSKMRWRIAWFTNSSLHRINGHDYLQKDRTTTWFLDLPSDAYASTSDDLVTIEVDGQLVQMWDMHEDRSYLWRGVKSPIANIEGLQWSLEADPKDGRRKLKVSATMAQPDERGGIVVQDYTIAVSLHSNPSLAIRTSTSKYADYQFDPGVPSETLVPSPDPAVWFFTGKNQGPAPMRFQLTGAGDAPGWRVRYFDAIAGGSEITADVTSGGWVSPVVQPWGMMQECRVEILPTGAMLAGTARTVTITAASAEDPARSDTVTARARAGNQPPPA
jgi:hypothetical protein